MCWGDDVGVRGEDGCQRQWPLGGLSSGVRELCANFEMSVILRVVGAFEGNEIARSSPVHKYGMLLIGATVGHLVYAWLAQGLSGPRWPSGAPPS